MRARELATSDDPHAWKRLEGPRWWAQPAWALTTGIQQAGVFEHQRQRAALAGVRARHPLLDPTLVQRALLAPPRASFDRELSRPLLRDAMRGLVPEAVRLRPGKAWFDTLIVDCLTGPDAFALRALLAGRDARTRELLEPGSAERTLAALSGTRGVAGFRAMHLTWRLLGLECWLRVQEDPSALPESTLAVSRPRVQLTRRPAPSGAGVA